MIQIDVHDLQWRSYFPELDEKEIAALLELAEKSRQRVQRGEIEAPESYEAMPYLNQRVQRLTSALNYLKSLRANHKLFDQV